MFELKPLSPRHIRPALDHANHYRILGESREAESICKDVLAIEPDHQEAITILVLAITDRFGEDAGGEVAEAKALLPSLAGEYDRAFYAGVICERKGKALLAHSGLDAGPAVFGWLDKAMKWFECAEELGHDDNDDARLRWNTCARIINEHKHVRPPPGPPSSEYRIADLAS